MFCYGNRSYQAYVKLNYKNAHFSQVWFGLLSAQINGKLNQSFKIIFLFLIIFDFVSYNILPFEKFLQKLFNIFKFNNFILSFYCWNLNYVGWNYSWFNFADCIQICQIFIIFIFLLKFKFWNLANSILRCGCSNFIQFL